MFDAIQAETQMIALKQSEYEIVKMRRKPGTTKNLFQSDQRTVKDMKRKSDAYAADTDRGENLYIRAEPDGVHEVVFVDDTHQQAVDFLAAQGIEPACIVETSVKHGVPSLHAWYLLSEPVDRVTRRAVEYTLIKQLHEQFPHDDPARMPGDFHSCDGGHLGRLAGSWNHGLSKPKNNAVTLVEATGRILSPEVTARLLAEAEENKKELVKLDADLEEIKNHTYQNPKIVQYFRENVVPKMDSRKPHYLQDFFATCYMLNAKFAEDDIKKVLWEHDPNPVSERKVGHEAHYLAVTLYKAQAKVGTPLSPKPSLAPSVGGGSGDAFCLSAGACASVPPSPLSAANPGATAPDIEKPYSTWGDGKRKRGSISPDGKIQFGVAPVDENPVSAKPKPRRKRLGVKPRY